jgi:hypothetical protein
MPFEFKIAKKARDALTNYANGKPAPMTYIDSYDGGKQSVITKVVTPLTSILKSEFGYSILVCVDTTSAEEINKYDMMGERYIPNGISYKKTLFDEDKMYLKLKVKDDAFEAFNLVTPEDYEEFSLEGMNLSVTFHMGIWINFEKKAAGSFLKIVSITKA